MRSLNFTSSGGRRPAGIRKSGPRAVALAFLLLALVMVGKGLGHEDHDQNAQESAATMGTEATAPTPPIADRESETLSESTGPSPGQHIHSAPQVAGTAQVLTTWLGRLHPMLIHFPIALFMSAFIAESLLGLTRKPVFRHSVSFLLWGGAISAVLAAPMGWIFAASAATETGWLLEAHRWTGTAVPIFGLLVLWANERTAKADEGRYGLRVLILIQTVIVGSAGFLGGGLLYGFDHLWRGIGTTAS